MGLAACQARYLSVTARKNTVEYEALLINQDRTALATRTSRIYTSLCELNQPTEPNSLDYYETNYTYSVSSGEEAGDYKISSYTYNAGTGKYTVNAAKTSNVQTASTAVSETVQKCEKNDDGTYTVTFTNGTTKTYSACTDSETPRTIINNALGREAIPKGEELYTYTDSDTSSAHYLTDTELQALLNKTANTYTDYSIYTTKTTENVVIDNADLTFDAKGKITKISTDKYSNVEVNSSTELNEVAYEQAMAEYDSQLASYYDEVAKLQAETAEMQQLDKSLELKLNQLDTEQDTLATELDSITKLLDENVKRIFKTFDTSS